MEVKFFLGIGLAIVLVFAGAAVYTSILDLPGPAGTPGDRETAYQVSTIDALMQGMFEGVRPVGELKTHGDFGIGTFDALDGEMIVLDGTVFQAKADGRVYRVSDGITTPLATVTYFDRDSAVVTGYPMNVSVFSSTQSARLPVRNMIYAVRAHGTFPAMKVRSIPAQEKPYPTLTAAAESQTVFTYADTTGTIAGFYTPVFFKGLTVTGYHLHFLSDDHTAGGHILDFIMPAETTVEYDATPQFTLVLPENGAFTALDLSRDLSKELAAVES